MTNFEIQKYYQNEPKFKKVYSQNNLQNTVKNGASVINLDECKSIGAHRIALHANANSVKCDLLWQLWCWTMIQ